ncbi:hypothetical protein [Pontibacter mucosus]|uniref:hypothetical protein n=1 Tax=Pontibacter mucosus TaxID=1649266 RepID=UPI0011B2781C|nr:hypothetical protein [Pontibacter mucosus]
MEGSSNYESMAGKYKSASISMAFLANRAALSRSISGKPNLIVGTSCKLAPAGEAAVHGRHKRTLAPEKV